MEYKLGELVEQVTETNTELNFGLNDIVGVTIDKKIIPTIANLKETDLKKFVIVSPNDFIYNPRTHGKKIGLGYNNADRKYIATWNNNTFRIKAEKRNTILSDYLYLYFNREIWDKEACFNSWGSSTVVFSWDSFCDMKINLPDIEEQKSIVREYQVIEKRIEILRHKKENLEKMALYSYQNILDNKNTKYTNIQIGELGNFLRGKNLTASQMEDGDIPVISAGIQPSGYHNKYNVKGPSITISGSGVNAGYISFHMKNIWASDCSYCNCTEFIYFLYLTLKSKQDFIINLQKGSAQPHVYPKDINPLEIKIPSRDTLLHFENIMHPVFLLVGLHEEELNILNKLKNMIIYNI